MRPGPDVVDLTMLLEISELASNRLQKGEWWGNWRNRPLYTRILDLCSSLYPHPLTIFSSLFLFFHFFLSLYRQGCANVLYHDEWSWWTREDFPPKGKKKKSKLGKWTATDTARWLNPIKLISTCLAILSRVIHPECSLRPQVGFPSRSQPLQSLWRILGVTKPAGEAS